MKVMRKSHFKRSKNTLFNPVVVVVDKLCQLCSIKFDKVSLPCMYNIVRSTGNLSSWKNFKMKNRRRLCIRECTVWGVSQTKLRRRECKEGCLAANLGFTILQLLPFFPLIISHISTFCHTQPFPPLSSHFKKKKMWFPFSPDFEFLPRGSLLAIPLNAMQWGQSLLSFFLSFFLRQKLLWQIVSCVGLAPVLVGARKETEE